MDVEEVPADGAQAKLDYGDRLKWIGSRSRWTGSRSEWMGKRAQ